MDETRYQVFVSSTFIDLKEERDKVLQALLQRKAFPSGMELFPAADQEQFEFIKREIDSSDYYVVIIAGRYGSLAEDGLSYTEKEYDYAKSRNKPILAFLHKDIQKLIGEKLETKEELQAKLAAFRSKAQSSRLVNFYETADELKGQVFFALTSQIDLRPMRGWVRAATSLREDLEKINVLQERVIRLEAENRRLLAEGGDTDLPLASGSDSVTWNLNFDDANVNTLWPTSRNISVTTTWDELLQSLFSKGSSFVNERDIKISLLDWITTSPQFQAPITWKQHLDAQVRLNKQWVPTFSAVQTLYAGIHIQFTGLGLISESHDTVYFPAANSANPIPKTISVWRLTSRGERQLASARGFQKIGLADSPYL